jgi:hypothetical protein
LFRDVCEEEEERTGWYGDGTGMVEDEVEGSDDDDDGVR